MMNNYCRPVRVAQQREFDWIRTAHRIVAWFAAALCLVLTPFGASAAVISFTPHEVGPVVTQDGLPATRWLYDYMVSAGAGEPAIDEFTIWFPLALSAELVVATAPAGWDPLVAQPDAALPADGFYDALALGVGIGPDLSLGGFQVQFDYLSAGAPGSQRFDIVDPSTFAIVSTGITTPAAAVVDLVEPGTPALLGAGLAALGMRRRRVQK